jgi:hypothetical protein
VIQRALSTALKDDIIDTTRSPTERWLIEAIEGGVWWPDPASVTKLDEMRARLRHQTDMRQWLRAGVA